MGATAFEYRHRYLLHTILYVLGFVAPWNFAMGMGGSGANAHAWGWLAAELAQSGAMTIAFAFELLLAVAIVLAFAGVLLRTWGASYLGAGVVASATMHTAERGPIDGIIEAGPYRYVRNPLYLGTILHTLALALVMPRSGAVFIAITIPIFQVRLILAEEAFLRERLGAAYEEYCARVPRLIPALRPRIDAQPLRPRWGQAALGESYMWCVAVAFVVAGWSYNSSLLIRCVVVSYGVSLVVRALWPGRRGAESLG